MAITNWTTETSTDPISGKTKVTVTVIGPTSQVSQQQWTSGAPPVAAPVVAGNVPVANAQLGSPDVQVEAADAGAALLAAVNAGTAAPGLTVVPDPDPSES